MWTIERIKSEIESFIDYANEIVGDIPSAKDVPVEIDGRMKRTLGYFSFEIDKKAKTVTPSKFKFAKILFEYYSDEDIIDTIKHEVVHYIVTLRYQKDMQHNEVYKQFCRALGVKYDIYFKGKPIKPIKKEKPRYKVKCGKCGAVATRKKMGDDRAFQILANCHCGNCSGSFKYIHDTKEDEILYLYDLGGRTGTTVMYDDREIYEETHGRIQ